MATKNRSQKRTTSKSRKAMKSRTMRSRQRGGDLGGNPASAWGWGMGTLGNGWTQFMNSLSLQPGQNINASQSNNIVPVGGVSQQSDPNMKVAQSGGKKRRGKGKRGGNLLAIAQQAAVPVALIAMNNAYGNRVSRRRSRRR
jgi:hypothetical protein